MDILFQRWYLQVIAQLRILYSLLSFPNIAKGDISRKHYFLEWCVYSGRAGGREEIVGCIFWRW
jgi:hypothetical protein